MIDFSNNPRCREEYYTVDTAANYGMGDEYAEHVVSVEFAMQLETELAAANQRVLELEKVLNKE